MICIMTVYDGQEGRGESRRLVGVWEEEDLQEDLHVIKELERRKQRDSHIVYGSKRSTRSADSTKILLLGI